MIITLNSAISEDPSQMCNPAVEACSAGEELVRPPVNALISLTITYFLNILLFPLSLSFMFGMGSFESDSWDILWFIFLWIASVALHVLVWAPPALTLLLYLIFGSSFFLFRFTDELDLSIRDCSAIDHRR